MLCTHSVKHLPSADHIVALGSDGKIVEQGPFLDLMTNDFGYVYSLGVKESSSEKSDDDITLASSNPQSVPGRIMLLLGQRRPD